MLKVVYKNNPGKQERTELNVLEILAYFSIFRYPLSRDEIQHFLHPDACIELLDESLSNLLEQKSIFKTGDWYFPEKDTSVIARRSEGNRRAKELLPKAIRIGKFLSRFPFVRGIGVSGSLSKMYADEKADIDFFIITSANRLWIAWAFMHLFKKLTFLAGKQNYFCMNYYVDEKSLEMEDKNIYTAVEIITLLPVRGNALPDFFTANGWVSSRFESYTGKQDDLPAQRSRSLFQRITEGIFNNRFGNWFDTYIMQMTDRRWKKKKERKMQNMAGRVVDLITDKHFARSNPGMFREKVLDSYSQKLKEILSRRPVHQADKNSHVKMR